MQISSSARVAAAALIACAWACPSSLGAAQAQGEIEGVVLSTDGDEPVAGARVEVEGADVRTVADAEGRFRLVGVPEGEQMLLVARLGYRSERVAVRVSAETPAEIEVRLAPAPVLLDEVLVAAAGELRRLAETAASVGRLDGEEIREVNPAHPSEVMNRMPGVWVSPTTTEGHMTAIRQPITTNPVYLFLEDGVPTRSPGFFNHNALYEVNVPQADGVEVIRGPGTSLYGSDAIGGVIDVRTRAPAPDLGFDATLGGSSEGYARALLSGSGTRGDDGVRLDVNLTDGESWRDGADYERRSATLRWDRRWSDVWGLNTTFTWSEIDQGEPSVLSREELRTDRSMNRHPITFRSVRALRLTSRLERRTDRSLLQVSPFLRSNRLELMPHWMLAFDPVVYESGHTSAGLMLRYHRDLEFLPGRVTMGVDTERSPGGRTEDRISVGRTDGRATSWSREDRLYDYDAVFTGVSPYTQLALRLPAEVHLSAGLRFDHMGFEYRNHLSAVQEGPHRRPADTTVHHSNLAPSLGATYSPVEEVNLFASWRESFRAPSEGQLFRQGPAESSVGLEPVRARSVEGGIRGELFGRLGYEVSLYRMELRDDILTWIRPEDGLRENLNAGRTRHQGVEIGVGGELRGGFSGDANLTRASHRFLEWSPRPGVDYAGNLMEQAPRELASARIQRALPGVPESRVEVEWVHMGEFWMDPENEHAYEGHDLWNLRFEVPLRGGVRLSGRVVNLADRVYAERASYHPQRGEELNPGAPRAFHLSLRYRWNR